MVRPRRVVGFGNDWGRGEIDDGQSGGSARSIFVDSVTLRRVAVVRTVIDDALDCAKTRVLKSVKQDGLPVGKPLVLVVAGVREWS